MASSAPRQDFPATPRWRRWQAAGTPAQRVDYWKDVVCEAVLDVAMTPGQEVAENAFHGSIYSRDQGGARLVNFRSASHRIQRTAGQADHASDEFLMISLQKRGACRLTQRQGEVELVQGDIGVLDSVQAFDIDFPADVERRMVLLPRALLQARLPSFRNLAGPHRLAANQALTRVLAETLSALTSRQDNLDDSLANTLLGSMADLLAVRFSQERNTAPSLNGEASFLRICRYIDECASEPGLTPAGIAQAHGMSLRTLQRLFHRHGAAGLGIEAHIVERRLLRAQRLLSQGAARNVSEAAFAAGFSDLSHFTRRFQGRFGVTPSAVLRRAGRGTAGA